MGLLNVSRKCGKLSPPLKFQYRTEIKVQSFTSEERHVGVSTSDALVEELLATDADPTQQSTVKVLLGVTQ